MSVRCSRYIRPAKITRPIVSSTNSSAPKKLAAAPPPGSAHTPSAISATMPKLRAAFIASARGEELPVLGALRDRRRRLHGRRTLGGLRGDPVADPEVRVDVAPGGRGLLELLAQLAHEDVDGAVAARHRVAPHPLVDLLALEHPPLGGGQQLDELELPPRQLDRAPGDERLELVGPDLDLTGRHRAAVAARL